MKYLLLFSSIDLSDTFENGNEKLDSEVADDDTKFNEDTENGMNKL